MPRGERDKLPSAKRRLNMDEETEIPPKRGVKRGCSTVVEITEYVSKRKPVAKEGKSANKAETDKIANDKTGKSKSRRRGVDNDSKTNESVGSNNNGLPLTRGQIPLEKKEGNYHNLLVNLNPHVRELRLQ